MLFNDALNTFYLRLYGVGQRRNESDSSFKSKIRFNDDLVF